MCVQVCAAPNVSFEQCDKRKKKQEEKNEGKGIQNYVVTLSLCFFLFLISNLVKKNFVLLFLFLFSFFRRQDIECAPRESQFMHNDIG